LNSYIPYGPIQHAEGQVVYRDGDACRFEHLNTAHKIVRVVEGIDPKKILVSER